MVLPKGGLWSGGAFALSRQTRGGFCRGGAYVLHSIKTTICVFYVLIQIFFDESWSRVAELLPSLVHHKLDHKLKNPR